MRRSLILAFALLVFSTHAATADNKRNDRLDTIFPPPPPSSPLDRLEGVCPTGQRCIPNYRCSNATITGEGLLDIRFKEDNPCVDYLLQCCVEQDIIQTASRPNTVNTSAQRPTPTLVSATDIDDEPVCGLRNNRGIGFRISSPIEHEAEYGEFPWMMSVMRSRRTWMRETVDKYMCGGSLIHPEVVLTVAHCIATKSANQLVVRAGEWDTQTTFEPFDVQDRTVTEVLIHPQFHKAKLHNDIALLFLNKSIELNDVIRPVCLPEQGTLFDSERCFVSGWGKDQYGLEGVYQVILKKVEVPVVPWSQCQQAIRVRYNPKYELHHSFMCAGGEKGKDACLGDGGSPLVCPIHGSDYYQQAGIVSWGIGCGEKAVPAGYTNVALYRDWIDQEMANRNLDTSSYVQ